MVPRNARLFGGPRHGLIVPITGSPSEINVTPPARPLPVTELSFGERPPWWKIRARRRWHPPAAFGQPLPYPVIYRYLATGDDGVPIFAHDPFATEPADFKGRLDNYLFEHYASVHPADRYSARWVLSRSWAYEVAKIVTGRPPTEEDVDRVNGGSLLGLPVEVSEHGGLPHLVTGPA